MEKKRPQLEAVELQQVRWVLGGVLALLGAWAALSLDVGAGPLATVAMLAIGTAMVRPELPARIPRLAHTLAFPVILAWFVVDLLLTGEVLAAMVRLDLLLLLYRGVTHRQRRDDLQMIVLGLFVVVVSGVLSVSLAFAFYVLAFTAVALALLFAITLSGAARIEAAEQAWTRLHWRRLAGRLRAVWDWRMACLGGGLFVGLVALTAGLFVLIPRFQLENSLFLERFITKKARTGFSETIRFGDVTEILQDETPALRVDVANPQRLPAVPYWRMVVLDEYRDGTFRLSPVMRRLAFDRERQGMTIGGVGRGTEGEWTFYLEAGVSRFLALPGDFGPVRFREPQTARRSGRLRVVALRDEPVTMTAYRVEGVSTAGWLPDAAFAEQWRESGGSVWVRALRQLRLSEADQARVRHALAEAGATRAESTAEWAERVCAWLARQHGYSLQPRIPEGEGDPLVRWLESREGGHCELFAGSLVVMAREAGFAARVVTGFKGGAWNGYSGNFTVRNSDAHAWCEVFDAERGGWLRVDPTPGGAAVSTGADALGPVAARRIDRSWSARLDSLRVFWYRRIVSFDQSSQLETWREAKTRVESGSKALREWLEEQLRAARAWAGAPWSVARALKWLGVVAALVGTGWAARRVRWTGPWRHWRARHGGDPVRREAGRWLATLRPRVDVHADEEVRVVVAELQRLRFGAEPSWPEPAKVWRRARRAARARK